jgi:hypothetical protein
MDLWRESIVSTEFASGRDERILGFGPRPAPVNSKAGNMIILLIILLLLFAGGGGYYGHQRWGAGGGAGIGLGTILMVVLVVYLLGGLHL